jgi:hypothetical protein
VKTRLNVSPSPVLPAKENVYALAELLNINAPTPTEMASKDRLKKTMTNSQVEG